MPDVRTPLDDEPWPQAALYDHLDLMAPSGVPGPPAAGAGAGDLGLTLNGLGWSVGLGRALVSGQRYRRTESPATGAVAANTNATLARRDRLVVRRDLAAKTTGVVRIQGDPAAQPVSKPLTLERAGVFDLPLFSFLVPPASGTQLTDVRDERMWLDPNGQGYYPCVTELRQDANQDINNNAWTPLNFDFEELDSWNRHTSAAPTRWTAPAACLVTVAGSYGWAVVAGNTAETARGVRIHKNGAFLPTSSVFGFYRNDRSEWISSKPTTVQLAAGDFLDVAAYQNCGIPLGTARNGDIKPGMSVVVQAWL